MRAKGLVFGAFVFAVMGGSACSDNNNPSPTGGAGSTGTAGAAGAAGSGAAGAAGSGAAGAAGSGAAGAAGSGAAGAQAFMSIDPCTADTMYMSGTTITVSPDMFVYTPPCLKVPAGTTVTIGGSAIHPLSARTGGSAGNPIPMHMMSDAMVTFPTAGFYPFQCDIHFSIGMKGVVWVTP
jgi:plastocyanin